MEFTIEDFKNLNSGNENLGEYDYSNWKGGSLPPFIFDEKKVKSNFEIFQEFQTARHIPREITIKPRTGDIVHLKDGSWVYICQVWDEKVQTCTGGSFSLLSSGSFSYSGGLDSGIKRKDLVITDEYDLTKCWFPEGDWLRAHSAVYAKCKVRVWKVKPKADLSGVWKSNAPK